MFTATEIIPIEELTLRRKRCLGLLSALCPGSDGLFITSRLAIYHLTGTPAKGFLWLPAEGEPLLLIRKGQERAALESPHTQAKTMRSFKELTAIFTESLGKAPQKIAVDKAVLPWDLGERLQKNLPGVALISGDAVLAQAKAVKTPWEQEKMIVAGARHYECLCNIFPTHIRPGMTELAIAHTLWRIYLDAGHAGSVRLSAFGEEMFLGNISAGTSSCYPSYFNGPIGAVGVHPIVPSMGNAAIVWQPNSLLVTDTCFVFEGYTTDKTQAFFSGPASALPTEAVKAHQCCLDIENATAASLKPGSLPSQLYKKSLTMAAEAGFAEGFMGAGGNKVPFLGHGIGLELDEWPALANRFDQPLEEGMTIAIEPKIGLPNFGMVGSENTYLVTKDGGKSLTGPAREIICLG